MEVCQLFHRNIFLLTERELIANFEHWLVSEMTQEIGYSVNKLRLCRFSSICKTKHWRNIHLRVNMNFRRRLVCLRKKFYPKM